MVIDVFKSIERELTAVDTYFLSSAPTDVALVWASAQAIVQSGGKRVRPALVLLSSQLFQHDEARAIRLASAVEMIHVASLLHDDVVDNAPQRRGMAATSVGYSNKVAILLADYLLTQALLELCKDDRVQYTRIISEATSHMALGQLKELEEQDNLDITMESYLRIITGKTAALFAACARLGALVGGAAPDEVEKMAAYGLNLGLGFQIVDDCLDLWGDAAALGKPVGNDLLEKKFTLPLIHALRHASPADVASIRAHLSNGHLESTRICEIRGILDGNGSREYALARARSYCGEARDCLAAFRPGPARTALEDLVDYVIKRDF
ncbi:MAG TPA: polyprenyl synthetase family protein [Candidatus Xenobia bacterium]|jgi:octaprenyl-diphosphate synthase